MINIIISLSNTNYNYNKVHSVLCIYGFWFIDSNNNGWKIFQKIPEKQNLNLPCGVLYYIYNYLCYIYIVLSIISNLEIIESIQVYMHDICIQYTILHKGVEHLQILVSTWFPGNNSLIQREGYITVYPPKVAIINKTNNIRH